jgi:hypothetical protein
MAEFIVSPYSYFGVNGKLKMILSDDSQQVVCCEKVTPNPFPVSSRSYMYLVKPQLKTAIRLFQPCHLSIL